MEFCELTVPVRKYARTQVRTHPCLRLPLVLDWRPTATLSSLAPRGDIALNEPGCGSVALTQLTRSRALIHQLPQSRGSRSHETTEAAPVGLRSSEGNTIDSGGDRSVGNKIDR
eukprot:GHVU01031330.1.p4 GENE.GHVU01031330.1~~GHVU01031330.1.p4  ORF type:complete len:114 (+),score=8.87 GHVU01031330.1:438-779(+)